MTATASSGADPSVTAASAFPVRHSDSYLIAAMGQKGGIGKTMLMLGLAMTCVHSNGRAAVWDTDPQANAFDLTNALDNPGFETIHDQDPNRLTKIRQERQVDTIFADCPGSIEGSAILRTIAVEATFVLLPFDNTMEIVPPFKRTVERLREVGTPHAAVLTLVPPGGAEERIHLEESRETLAALGVPVLNSYVREYKAWQNSLKGGVPITRWSERHSPKVREDLSRLHTEVLINIGRGRTT